MTDGGINKLVDVGQRIAILGACLIEVSEIDAHAPFGITLPDHHDVRKPGVIVYRSYESSYC